MRSAALGGVALSVPSVSQGLTKPATVQRSRPNILMICADQFRADFVGANKANPSVRTPNLDALAQRGTNFKHAVCNQPLCSPSRASFLTGVTATEAGIWRIGQELNHTIPTIATTFKAQGYTTAFMGKWHVTAGERSAERSAKQDALKAGAENRSLGWVAPGPSRGGFDDLWEGANVIENVSHPYQGHYWDNGGNDVGFKDVYRVDFITDRASHFLEQQSAEKPWLLFVSQLEPHQQNDMDEMVPPNRYAKSYNDAFVPDDLRPLPGNWQTHLPGYYGCVQAIDDCVGKLVATLDRTGQLNNTVIVFFSDHGCTFQTRLGEYKRSPHDASLRVPLIFAGPGFDRGTVVDEIVSLIDLTPTLIDAAAFAVPMNMKGRSLKPLVDSPEARKGWDTTAYIQLSSAICGRAIRTPEWVYCCYDPTVPHGNAAGSKTYQDFALYSTSGDPHQQVNLVGREMYRQVCDKLRAELLRRIVANGEPEPVIQPVLFYA
jgi:arylsulfatase A-like enzyme